MFKKNHSPYKVAGILAGSLFCSMILLSVIAALLPNTGLHLFFSSVCHQQFDRSHQFHGHTFGLCIRCFWLYLGLSLGCFAYGCMFAKRKSSKSFLMVSLLIVGIHWMGGWFFPILDWVYLRIASSLMLGFAISQYLVPGLAELLFSTSHSNKTLELNHESKRT